MGGITLLNENPEPTDILSYTKQEGLQDCPECCPSDEQIFYGDLDTTIYCINNGNEAYSVLYSIFSSNTVDIISANDYRSILHTLILHIDTCKIVTNISKKTTFAFKF